jgi:hypothetical protein
MKYEFIVLVRANQDQGQCNIGIIGHQDLTQAGISDIEQPVQVIVR